MIKAFQLFCLIVLVKVATGQPVIVNQAKQSVKNKLNQKVDEKTNKAIDKASNGSDTVLTGAAPKNTERQARNEPPNSATGGAGNSLQTDPALKAYSKFDFVPGETILSVDDFAEDSIGDFPAKWNTTSSGEVKSFAGRQGKWLALVKPGIFYPEDIKILPENFTLEYDVAASANYNAGSAWFEISIIKAADENEMKGLARNSGDRFRIGNSTNGITIRMHPSNDDGSYYYRTFENGSEVQTYLNRQNSFTNKNNIVHVAIWKQKTRIRMYINQEKILDLPKVMNSNYNRIIFSPNYAYANTEDMLYLSNLKLAMSDANAKNKLLTEGKFTSHGILFESGSDRIIPQSYGAVKEIAALLIENPSLTINIVGHTDSEGENAANLLLSQKRAGAVKKLLVNDFTIDAVRLQTSGKGEIQPITPNTTAIGRATNRRVEFIKL